MCITKTIVILAKSIKHGRHCVAGKDINSKEWIRVVSDAKGSELSEQQSKCTNDNWEKEGKNPYNSGVLKKVEIIFSTHSPLIHQPENHVVLTNHVWQQKYKIEPHEIQNYLDNPKTLWGDNNDRVNYSLISNQAVVIQQSLYLIKVDDLHLYRTVEDKRRASFFYLNQKYDLSVTDINFDSLLETGNANSQNILCISLGENFNGNCYKIIAAIY